MASRGARELIIIAQDTSAYGKDLPNEANLALLLRSYRRYRKFAGCGFYTRILQPSILTSSGSLPKSQDPPLVDLPLQHANNDVLVRMGRGSVAGTKGD